jgi:hypothetical protein
VGCWEAKEKAVAPPWETPMTAWMGVGMESFSRIVAMSLESWERVEGDEGVEDWEG